ncbi:BtpA/SgcQ family protein [Histidinibacterium lentulum]|uniref:BtpA family membrane complex biogenesis protein n=1 Tax=Histidinibacterium lentulum TaxID=2480588 RepID=A0A3N2QSC2_9RHOB|nr:BtpA/SgcQ family protein [Histidinibacterium lentulum]ROT98107.1 BtpA family membrane complex biogenesis protein [Histidinibacterium lentulum]
MPTQCDVLSEIFGRRKPLIGNVHLPPLPGTPRYRGAPVSDLIAIALKDVRAYEEGGMDGLMLENHGDVPFVKPQNIGPEVIAAMSAIVQAVSERTALPFGINLLANHAIGAIAVAHATGARFVRVNQWVNGYVANEGFLDGLSGEALRFRRMIGADSVAIFADVHVKHGAHAVTSDRSVSELARDTEFFDADVAIATGNRTGDTIPEDEIAAIRVGTTLPVIGGSGLTAENAPALMALLDGAVVGSSVKSTGHWSGPVDRSKVEDLVASVRDLRGR